MKRFKFAIIVIVLVAMIGCSPRLGDKDIEEVTTATATLPNPQVFITPAPNLDDAIETFMDAWRRDDYIGMYGLLSIDSRGALAEEDFIARYNDAAIALTLLFDV